MVSHPTVVKFHFRAAQCTVLGHTPSHSLAPELEGVGAERMAHEANDIGLGQPDALLKGLEGSSVLPSHLNHSRHIPRRQACEPLGKFKRLHKCQ